MTTSTQTRAAKKLNRTTKRGIVLGAAAAFVADDGSERVGMKDRELICNFGSLATDENIDDLKNLVDEAGGARALVEGGRRSGP